MTKLILSKNRFSGEIPSKIGSCSRLQLLDLSSNILSGHIPPNLGKIPSLEISLNLSYNNLSGEIPKDFTNLKHLTILDLSHNLISGDLLPLSPLQNLVTLDISSNNFSGQIPNSSFFSNLPISNLAGNPNLLLPQPNQNSKSQSHHAMRILTASLLSSAVFLLGISLLMFLSRGRSPAAAADKERTFDEEKDGEFSPPWQTTLYQKLDIPISEITNNLTPTNFVGKGRSGTVYSVTLPSAEKPIAVKKFRFENEAATEISILADIRHRNIVRLIGWAGNRRTRVLFYDYLPNGTLGQFLHGAFLGVATEWEVRLGVAIGVAEGLAYLHHDCVPPIIHRDVKPDNVLLRDNYEPCLADFGVACFDGEASRLAPPPPPFAGSYGYIAPG